MTTEQDLKPQFPNINPTGKGGFGDNPQNRNAGGRPKNEQRFGYWMQLFKNLTNEEFVNYTKTRSENDMFVAEIIAYERVKKSRYDLKEFNEVADRTEGKAIQRQELTGKGGESLLAPKLSPEDIAAMDKFFNTRDVPNNTINQPVRRDEGEAVPA